MKINTFDQLIGIISLHIAIFVYVVSSSPLYSYRESSYLGFSQEVSLVYWLGLFLSVLLSLFFSFKAKDTSDDLLSLINIFLVNMYLYGFPPFVSKVFSPVSDGWVFAANALRTAKEGGIMFTFSEPDRMIYTTALLTEPGVSFWFIPLWLISGLHFLDILQYFPLIQSTFTFFLSLAFLRLFLRPPHLQLALLFCIVGCGFGPLWLSASALGVLYYFTLLYLLNTKGEKKKTALMIMAIFAIIITHFVSSLLLLITTVVAVMITYIRPKLSINARKYLSWLIGAGMFSWYMWVAEPGFRVFFVSPIREFISYGYERLRFESILNPVIEAQATQRRSLSALLKISYAFTYLFISTVGLIFTILKRQHWSNEKRMAFISVIFITPVLFLCWTISALVSVGVLYQRVLRYAILPLSLLAVQCCKTRSLKILFLGCILVGSVLALPASYIQEYAHHVPPEDVAGSNFMGWQGIVVQDKSIREKYHEYAVHAFFAYHAFLGDQKSVILQDAFIFSDHVKKHYMYMFGSDHIYYNDLLYSLASRSLIYNNGQFLLFLESH